jgi:hypothetical protein
MACALRLLPDLFDGMYTIPGCVEAAVGINGTMGGGGTGGMEVVEGSCAVSWLHSQTLSEQSLIDAGPSRQYIVALYWATMTLTTIGYGDVTARTDAESVFMTICMIVSSALYAYTIGEVCGIVQTMDEATRMYNKQADMINYFCADHDIPQALSMRLREYFRNSRSMHRSNYYQLLLPSMSPALAGEVSAHINSNVEKNQELGFFRAEDKNERKRFLTALTMSMQRAAFGPQEIVITRGQRMKGIFLVRHGIAFGGVSSAFGQVYTVGKWFGAEGLLLERRYTYEVRSLNFLIVDIVTKKDVDAILWSGEYPETFHKMRLTVMKTIFKQCFKRAADVYKYVQSIQGEKFELCKVRFSKDQIDYIRDGGTSDSDKWVEKSNTHVSDVYTLVGQVQREMHEQHEQTQLQIRELSTQLQQVLSILAPGTAEAGAAAAEVASAKEAAVAAASEVQKRKRHTLAREQSFAVAVAHQRKWKAPSV